MPNGLHVRNGAIFSYIFSNGTRSSVWKGKVLRKKKLDPRAFSGEGKEWQRNEFKLLKVKLR